MGADEIILISSSNFCIVATEIDDVAACGKAQQLLRAIQDELVEDYMQSTQK